MTSNSKRLKTYGVGVGGGGTNDSLCIIHFPDSKSDTFTFISDTQDPENRLHKFQDISRKRLSQPAESLHIFAHICSQIPLSLSPEHGYHRDCYQRFTGKLDRLIDVNDGSTSDAYVRADTLRGSKRLSSDKFIFNPNCIFCRSEGRKKIRKATTWTSEALVKFEFGGGSTVLKAEENKQDHDLLRRIKGFDLFASEAQFHPSCCKK